jgi:hypothetical protein
LIFIPQIYVILETYGLQLCVPSQLTGPYSAPVLTPSLIGIPLLTSPQSSKSNDPRSLTDTASHLSKFVCNEDEQDQTGIFSLSFGSSPPSLFDNQRRRFKIFLSDLKLKDHLVEESIVSTSLAEKEAEVGGEERVAREDRCKSKLMLVHSATFEF